MGGRWRFAWRCFGACALAGVVVGCTNDFDGLGDGSGAAVGSSVASGAGGTTGSGGNGAAAASSGATGSGGATTSSSAASSGQGGAGGSGGQPGEVVYAASQTTLYTFDVAAHTLSTVAAFSGCGAVREIAMSGGGALYAEGPAGAGQSSWYSIDAATGACTPVIEDTFIPRALGFVAAGTLDPSVEVLVGYSGADYFRIDPGTGGSLTVTAAALATYTGIDVVMGAGAVYVAVDKSGCTSDCFVAIDAATGVMLQSPPPSLMHGDGIAGLAYASGSAWAFGRTGDVLQVDPSTSAAVVVARTDIMFEGAASHP